MKITISPMFAVHSTHSADAFDIVRNSHEAIRTHFGTIRNNVQIFDKILLMDVLIWWNLRSSGNSLIVFRVYRWL